MRDYFEARTRKEDRGYETLCWVWTLDKFASGYAKATLHSKTRRMHRVSYEAFVGEIPDGLMVLHHCDQVDCVNPTHLYAGTAKDNATDRGARQRWSNGNNRRTECKHGHAFTPENTKVALDGHRACRECKRVSERARYARKSGVA